MHNSNSLEEQWELIHPDIPKNAIDYKEAYTVWEVVIADRTIHLFTTEEAAKLFISTERFKKALSFLAPNARVIIHEISVMELK